MKIIRNPNKKVADEVAKAVKDNDGYCPCKLDKTPDTKCMCKEFRETTNLGLCHCGLYGKIADDGTVLDLMIVD